jgi:hypothetical protein
MLGIGFTAFPAEAIAMLAQVPLPGDGNGDSFLSLGVAGLLTVMALMWQRDTAKRAERAEAQVAATVPLNAKVADALIDATRAHDANARAVERLTEAINRQPSQDFYNDLQVTLREVVLLLRRQE